jgi:hypothetical protein
MLHQLTASPLTPSHPALSLPTNLSILEYEEAHIPAVMDVVLPEERRGIVLDPHPSQLVIVNIIKLESTLQTCTEHVT